MQISHILLFYQSARPSVISDRTWEYEEGNKGGEEEEGPLMEPGILLCATGNEAASCLSLLGNPCR